MATCRQPSFSSILISLRLSRSISSPSLCPIIYNKRVGDKSVSPERNVGDRAFIIDHAVGFTGARGRENGANLPNEPPYEIDLNNPFPMMKLNSDVLHSEMSKLIQEQEAHIGQRIFDWFLL